jgi:hypothetical protein
MTQRPSIAIVVNNYNYERYVGAAVASALSQSEPADQVIVVDDGSTDGSRAVLEQYAARADLVFQENAGQGAAFNAGWARVSSDVVVFLDSDDLLWPAAVEAIRATWQPDQAKLHWSMTVIDASGRPTGELFPPRELVSGFLRDQLLTTGPENVVFASPPTSGNAFSADALRSVMPLDEIRWRIAADTPLLTAAPLAGSLVVHPEPLSAYRIHGDNAWEASAQDKSARDLELLRGSTMVLQQLCPEAIPYDAVERWVDRSPLGRLMALRELVVSAVPSGESCFFLDDWWTGWTEVEGRRIERPWECADGPPSLTVVPWWKEVPPGLVLLASNDGGVVARDADQ